LTIVVRLLSLTEEVVVEEPHRPAPLAMFEFHHRRSGIADTEFRKGMQLSAVPAAPNEEGLIVGHLQSFRVATNNALVPEMDELTATTSEQPWDVVAAMYFNSVAHVKAYIASPAYEARQRAQSELVDVHQSVAMVTRRHVIVDVVR
jgi:hypothetical protein